MNLETLYEKMEYGPAPESPNNAEQWLKEHQHKFSLFINGKWTESSTKNNFESINPATGKSLASISEASEKEVDQAVKAAKKAFESWNGLDPHQRSRFLYAMARQMQKHARLLAVLETLDNGKTIRETRDIDVPLAVRHFYHHAGWAQLLDQEFKNHQPLGVVGQIIPWNFPLLMLAWKVAPALAAGNTVVLKPAEFTPLTALWFAEMCQRIGLPSGVFNLLTGSGTTGAMLAAHSGVSKIAFTGSTEVGRQIRENTASSDKKLTLELGGKSPFLVFEDADLDSTVEGIVDAIWFNQGQVCCAGSRMLVQERIANRLLEKLRDRMKKLRVGDPLDKGMDMGAIIAPVQLKRIQNLLEQGLEEGGDVWQWEGALPKSGCFFPPTLISNVDPASMLAQTEIFGPVLVSSTFRTHDEAVALANNTAYGLAASVWSENINLALDVAPRLKAGVVWINCTNQFDASSGFGGYRESGFGREGGHEGMFEYLKPRWESSWEKHPQRFVYQSSPALMESSDSPMIDRTPKLYIGGKQTRPDSGYSITVLDAHKKVAGEVGHGNRKDIRNAVEAAHKASAWSSLNGHSRAQVLYFLAENLETRSEEFKNRISVLTGDSADKAKSQVEASIRRIFSYAAWADKYEGRVHQPPMRGLALAIPEPFGVMGVVASDDQPLLGLLSMILPCIASGNRVVAVPSLKAALIVADFYQLLDTSDVPGGVINLVTGVPSELATVLAAHDDVAAIWAVGPADECEQIKKESAGNLKSVWTSDGKSPDWYDSQAEGSSWLERATQVKNIWVPYGE